MNHRFKKGILVAGFAIIAVFISYHYGLHEKTGIYNYKPSRDRQMIFDIFKDNWYWLISENTPDFSPAFWLDNRAYNKTPQAIGKEIIRVMVVDGVPVGFVAYHIERFYEGFIHFLAVKESVRNKGYAKKLMRYAIDDLTNMGVKFIGLITRTDNYSAQKVYRQMGFEETHRDDRFVSFKKRIK